MLLNYLQCLSLVFFSDILTAPRHSIPTFSIKGLYLTLSKTILCHYTECHLPSVTLIYYYAECRIMAPCFLVILTFVSRAPCTQNLGYLYVFYILISHFTTKLQRLSKNLPVTNTLAYLCEGSVTKKKKVLMRLIRANRKCKKVFLPKFPVRDSRILEYFLLHAFAAHVLQ